MMLVKRVIISLCLSIWNVVAESSECTSNQYIIIGYRGSIECTFQSGVYGVFWYNSADPFHDVVIITSEDSIKKGAGYLSGEFDISQSGSLIITNVSMKHEGTNTVFKLETPTSKTMAHVVIVSVIASTFSRSPAISDCHNISEVCFQTLDEHSQLSCTVKDSRQAIPLQWMVRTTDGDRNVPSIFYVESENSTFVTSRVTTNDFFFTPFLTLLVCKAESPPGLLEENEATVLIQSGNIPTDEAEAKFIEMNSKLELSCAESQTPYLVWQVMKSSDQSFNNILYSVFIGKHFTHTEDNEYQLKKTSSLVLEAVSIQHEGLYRCVSGDELEDKVKVYDVRVFVSPVPDHPVVGGCSHQQYCVLRGHNEGNVTCILKRVRPQVKLDVMELFQESSDAVLQFYNKILVVRENGDTFDVYLTSKYRFEGPSKTKLTIECKVIGTNIKQFHLSRIFDMWFEDGSVASTEGSYPTNVQHLRVIIPVAVLVFSVLILCTFAIFKAYQWKKRSKDHKRSSSEIRQGSSEIMPLVQQQHPSVSKKDLFISELKAKYQDLYEAVQPIPYIRDRLYSLHKVFIEGGIEYMVTKEKIGGPGKWEKLSTYQSLLEDDHVKSKRRIIEGDPGYGKSTLTLQLAYDWCNEINGSYLKNTDILILLRLRQLGGVTSIYRAIRQFLLPKDSQLSELDVKEIMHQQLSTLVVLDGYDEYPDRDGDAERDVISIITRKMFQQFEVILTTRSSHLPKDYPGVTKRLKLTGFDENARDEYVRKAVVGDDTDAAEKVKRILQENPVLGYVCEVPLFFVMYAHMSHESKQFQEINSVTGFFRYMISCFHSHMKNKMKDLNVKNFDLFEKNHSELNKLAFEALSGKDQKIAWKREDMLERLGSEFYNQYVRIGILLEEQVLEISDFPSTQISEHIQYQTEVRFYHKIFCEWYAGHQLCNYFSTVDSKSFDRRNDNDMYGHFLNIQESTGNKVSPDLQYLDPVNHQYVYLFACGLSSELTANKIRSYLLTKEQMNHFVIMCLLEQSGNEDNILEDVEDLCKTGFVISNDNSLLLQRSTIQLLKISSKHEVSISSVKLTNCYSAVEVSDNGIHLTSELSLPILSTLTALEIWESGRNIAEEELTQIVRYSTMCDGLKDLTLSRCLLPQFNEFPADIHAILKSRKVKVYWWPRIRYRLNLESCLWEDMERGMVITNEEYQLEVDWCKSLET